MSSAERSKQQLARETRSECSDRVSLLLPFPRLECSSQHHCSPPSAPASASSIAVSHVLFSLSLLLLLLLHLSQKKKTFCPPSRRRVSLAVSTRLWLLLACVSRCAVSPERWRGGGRRAFRAIVSGRLLNPPHPRRSSYRRGSSGVS